ncbi:MAG: TonB-dependent receptor [Sphingobacteriales bacterium]|nr:MAG: TonB-dependent receptor [Sphingobacteriales bacterium]
MRFRLSPLSAALLLTTSAHAQLTDTTQNLRDVEVRAIRAGSNAPFAKTNLRDSDIRKANLGQDLPYILQLTPSAVVNSDAGTGVGYTGLRIRGTDGTRINVTLNGVPVNDAESQGTFFVNFADVASSTGSIQIQRGVGTSTNGPGAFGATVSLDNLAQRDTAGADITVTGGSFNTQRYTVKAGTGWLPGGFRVDARLSKIASDGFIDRSASNLKAAQLIGSWQASPRTSLRALVMTGTEKTEQAWNGVPEEKLRGTDSALQAQYAANLGYLYNTRADSVNLFTADPRRYNAFLYGNQTDNYQQDYYQLHLNHQFRNGMRLHAAGFYTRGRGYYEEYKYGEKYSSYGLTPAVYGTDTLTRTDLVRQLWLDNHYYGGVASLTQTFRNTTLTLGGSASQYLGRHYGFVKWAANGSVAADYRWYNLDSRKTDLNSYLKAEHRIGSSLSLFGELQLRYVDYVMNGFRKNPELKPGANYLFFNPKAGLSYALQQTARQQQRVYASIAVARKEPNRDDFEAGATSQPKAEQLVDVEGGYTFRNAQVSVGINGYYMQYRDQLVVTGKINDVGAYTRTNVPNSFRRGVELEAAYQPFRKLTLSGNLTLSQNKIESFTEYLDAVDADYNYLPQQEIQYSNTDLAFSPSVVSALMVTVAPFKGFEADLIGKYVSRQYLDNTGAEARSLNPYELFDLRLRYALPLRRGPKVAFSLLVANLLNKKYEANGYTYSLDVAGTRNNSNFYFPQAGTHFLGGLTIRF